MKEVKVEILCKEINKLSKLFCRELNKKEKNSRFIYDLPCKIVKCSVCQKIFILYGTLLKILFCSKCRKKNLARQQLGSAVRLGKIKKQLCEICGEKAIAHHPDYNKPLDVRWLCHSHHRFVHSGKITL